MHSHLFVKRLSPGNSSAMISHIPEELPLYVHVMTNCTYHENMLTQVRGPGFTLLVLQFTEPSPVKSWCYHISENSGFSANTWSAVKGGGGGRRCPQDVNRPCCYCGATWAHRYCLSCILQKWLMIGWPVVPPSVTADCRGRALWFINALLVARKYDLDWNVEWTEPSWTTTDRT